MIRSGTAGFNADDIIALERAAAHLHDIAVEARAVAASAGSPTPALRKIATTTAHLIAGSATGVDQQLLQAIQVAMDKLMSAEAALHQASVFAADLARESTVHALAAREQLAAHRRMEPM
ncbi:hypothetical protein [Mycolicibacterium vanbaalenii]|uniref:hypothetical protein n=1 Tax=Mycolicibacterium vanbaalenii TaxID=110539 RepID=UPI00006E9B78|nr:hypothetical protein [Mycolicibacterium vanbaalenii]MCV7130319.1 hypothetical protein [Mycolicibacterium vanbaalenii PYR-1]